EYGRADDVVVIDDRKNPGAGGGGGLGEKQPAKLVELGAEVIAVAHALQIHSVDAVDRQDGIELVEAAKTFVGVDRDIPSEAPPRARGETPLRLPRSAPAGIAHARYAASVPALINGGKVDAVLAVFQPVPPFALQEQAVVGPVFRCEGEIVVGCQSEIVGQF